MTPFCSSGGGGDQDNSAVNGEADEAEKFWGTPVGTVVMEKQLLNTSNKSNSTK